MTDTEKQKYRNEVTKLLNNENTEEERERLANMSQDEYAKYLENIEEKELQRLTGWGTGDDDIYELLTRRPELRNTACKDIYTYRQKYEKEIEIKIKQIGELKTKYKETEDIQTIHPDKHSSRAHFKINKWENNIENGTIQK